MSDDDQALGGDIMKKKLAATTLAALITLTGLTGCSGGNKAGDTTCKDYKAMSSSQKKDVITAYLKAKGKEPANGEITLNQLSASAYCATAGRDSDPIRKIEG